METMEPSRDERLAVWDEVRQLASTWADSLDAPSNSYFFRLLQDCRENPDLMLHTQFY